MQTVKLVQRSGNNRTYSSDKRLIGVVVCKDPSLYVTTGYYIRLDRGYPNEVTVKAYRSAIQAARAAYNSI